MHKRSRIAIVSASVAAVALLLVVAFSVADEYFEHDEHHEKWKDKHHDKKNKHDSQDSSSATENHVYVSLCGGCHWAYVPALLPSKSWENILATLPEHFGSDVQITDQQRKEVAMYLLSNASDKSSLKVGRKITQSLGGAIPGRIVDVPYIVRKHKKIDRAILSLESIKTLSNCIACHPSAANALFNDDDVRIPSK
jgi:hypothetical protein